MDLQLGMMAGRDGVDPGVQGFVSATFFEHPALGARVVCFRRELIVVAGFEFVREAYFSFGFGLIGIVRQAGIEEVFGGVGADQVEQHAVLGGFSSIGDVLRVSTAQNLPAWGVAALDGDHPPERIPSAANEVVDGVGMVSCGVDGVGFNRPIPVGGIWEWLRD